MNSNNLGTEVTKVMDALMVTDISNLIGEIRDLERDLNKAHRRAEEAKDQVGLLDKINIFTKSDSERERDHLKKEEQTLRSKLGAVENQIKERVMQAVPEEMRLQCIMGDMQHAMQLVKKSMNNVNAEVDHLFRSFEELNDQAAQQGLNRVSFGSARRSINENFELSAKASDLLIEDFNRLHDHMSQKINVPKSIFRSDDLVEQTLSRLKQDYLS